MSYTEELAIWRMRRKHFREELAREIDPWKKFDLKLEVHEAEEKIRELTEAEEESPELEQEEGRTDPSRQDPQTEELQAPSQDPRDDKALERIRKAAEEKLSQRLKNFDEAEYITYGEFLLFLDARRKEGAGEKFVHWPERIVDDAKADESVKGVTADEANDFCNWLNERDPRYIYRRAGEQAEDDAVEWPTLEEYLKDRVAQRSRNIRADDSDFDLPPPTLDRVDNSALDLVNNLLFAFARSLASKDADDRAHFFDRASKLADRLFSASRLAYNDSNRESKRVKALYDAQGLKESLDAARVPKPVRANAKKLVNTLNRIPDSAPPPRDHEIPNLRNVVPDEPGSSSAPNPITAASDLARELAYALALAVNFAFARALVLASRRTPPRDRNSALGHAIDFAGELAGTAEQPSDLARACFHYDNEHACLLAGAFDRARSLALKLEEAPTPTLDLFELGSYLEDLYELGWNYADFCEQKSNTRELREHGLSSDACHNLRQISREALQYYAYVLLYEEQHRYTEVWGGLRIVREPREIR